MGPVGIPQITNKDQYGLNESILANRRILGLPHYWATIRFWLTASTTAQPSEPTSNSQKPKMFPNIPELIDYSLDPPESFWKNFPSNPIPSQPETKIIVANLEKLINKKQAPSADI